MIVPYPEVADLMSRIAALGVEVELVPSGPHPNSEKYPNREQFHIRAMKDGEYRGMSVTWTPEIGMLAETLGSLDERAAEFVREYHAP